MSAIGRFHCNSRTRSRQREKQINRGNPKPCYEFQVDVDVDGSKNSLYWTITRWYRESHIYDCYLNLIQIQWCLVSKDDKIIIKHVWNAIVRDEAIRPIKYVMHLSRMARPLSHRKKYNRVDGKLRQLITDKPAANPEWKLLEGEVILDEFNIINFSNENHKVTKIERKCLAYQGGIETNSYTNQVCPDVAIHMLDCYQQIKLVICNWMWAIFKP